MTNNTAAKPMAKSKITTVRPKNFDDDAKVIADCLREEVPVIINLEDTSPEHARRIIDFALGTTYAIDGDVQQVSEYVFVCTPKTVMVTFNKEEQKQEVAKKITATLAEYAELPIVVAANMEMRIGDEAYRTLRGELKDFRYELDSHNIAPTYKGNFADMADPGIRDFVFCRGESITPVSYEIGGVHHWGMLISEHDALTVSFTI